MEVDQRNYTWQSGDDNDIEIRYKDPAGVIIPITSAKMALKVNNKQATSPTLEIDAVEIVDSVDGNYWRFRGTSDETAAILPAGKTQARFYYDAQFITGEGKTVTLLGGIITLKVTITDPV